MSFMNRYPGSIEAEKRQAERLVSELPAVVTANKRLISFHPVAQALLVHFWLYHVFPECWAPLERTFFFYYYSSTRQ